MLFGGITLSGERFDELAKDLAAKTSSRRGFLAGLAGAAATALFRANGASAQVPGPGSSTCSNEGQSCAAQQCCQGLNCLTDFTNATEKFCCSPNSPLVCGSKCCPTGAVLGCSAGKCTCPTGEFVCPDTSNPLAGKCVNLAEDVNNCGECGGVCPQPTGPDAPCLVTACINGKCTFVNGPNGTPCNDGNACTQTDTCQNGKCVGGTPIVCTPRDQCHEAGTCDPATGLCSNPAKPDGIACDDGNLCTVNDTCQAGICTPGAPKNCNDNNECTADTCDPATGCVHTPLTGTPCETGNKCTTDTCDNGVCKQGSPSVTCPQCQVCDPNRGTCVNLENGTTCTDGDVCTLGDTCENGTCKPGPVKTCDQCQVCANVGGVATCVPDTSKNGQTCNDGNACTTGETCQNGVCTGGTLKNCNDNNTCTTDTCDPSTGVCVHTAVADNTPCGGAMQKCCSGTCTNVSNNKNNCGACGVKCPGMQNCKDGVCS